MDLGQGDGRRLARDKRTKWDILPKKTRKKQIKQPRALPTGKSFCYGTWNSETHSKRKKWGATRGQGGEEKEKVRMVGFTEPGRKMGVLHT